MGIAENPVLRFFWKYVKGAEWDDRKVFGGSVEALQPMASQNQYPTEWAVVAAAVVSTVAGLRVREMAGSKVRGVDGIRGTI